MINYLVESDPDAWRLTVVTVVASSAFSERVDVEWSIGFTGVLGFDVVKDAGVDGVVVSAGGVVLDGDAAVVGETSRLGVVHWAELGESVEARDLETGLESRLVVVDGGLHDGDGGHEETGEEGEVGDVENGDLD